ncbi:hypothetical protein RO3G_07430 [Lichtheimia corymbifera JMRC:FSU:9682]|uniref:Solute carrier family 66 member 2 n=1 Tax=Lichtheimia corymbifera JMRC:FSU:9682 TaxID=1263082 RepID=A0A068SA49_9FUNG|nr:hypothetical protein RO3G_07430 [Lichtheimia corymbifera JMRC:FSU:9682]
MPDFAQLALSVAMVIGPIVGYIDQYFIIRRKQSSAGFNSMTCAVLLIANILRVFFWFGKRFDTTLFAQSIVMILAMLVLLEIVVRYRHHPSPLTLYSNLDDQSSVEYDDEEDEELVGGGGTSTQRSSSMIPLPRFIRSCWAWNHYIDYINFLLGFTTFVAVLYLLLGRFPAFVEVLGFVSVGIESTLPVPQCISNFRRRSTAGFSFLVLGSWFFGDSFKLFYFIYTHSPLQFIICGAIQLSIDSVIVLQFILFSERVKKRLGIGQPQHVPVLDDSDST